MNPHDPDEVRERYKAALASHVAQRPHEDTEAAAWVRDIEDEALLCQFFNGWDGVEAAKAKKPQLVERALHYMRAMQQLERAQATSGGTAITHMEPGAKQG